MTSPAEPAQRFILVEGGVVSNDPALPVFDLDIISEPDSAIDDDLAWQQLVDLYDRMLAHREQYVVTPVFDRALARVRAKVCSVADQVPEVESLVKVASGDPDRCRDLLSDIALAARGGDPSPALVQIYAKLAINALGGIAGGELNVSDFSVEVRLDDAVDQTVQVDDSTVLTTPERLAAGVDEHAQITGVRIDAYTLEQELPWN